MKDRQRVTGIGGVFFKARDPEALAAWYRECLGVPVEDDQTYATFTAGRSESTEHTVWSTFPADTTYFGQDASSFMINFRVEDLDAMLAQLREAGADVDEHVEEFGYGRFGWATDPEGNRLELWEPAGDGFGRHRIGARSSVLSPDARLQPVRRNHSTHPNAAMAESTLKASASRAILLFYVIAALLLLAFTADLVQGDGVDWILLGGAVAALVAGIAYRRKRRRS
ncbi:MAG: hypothetical protein GVY25_04115 [Bacteroidetes bacterium]|jgi:predicted enzyme related to lactoylglutathione lyase|nr:hypothetical protein [Bacteroidota bacterium]